MIRKSFILIASFLCFGGNLWAYESSDLELVDEVYQIKTAQGLIDFANGINDGSISNTVQALLTADIDMTDKTYTPIGNASHPFSGTFDGQGHTIDNLSINIEEGEALGIFGRVGGSDDSDVCTIRNLIAGPHNSIKGKQWVGGLIGASQGKGTIQLTNCGHEGEVEASEVNAAAMLGCMFQCALKINNCYNTGSVKGDRESAIICAWLAGHKFHWIDGFWNIGTIEGNDSYKTLYRNNTGESDQVSQFDRVYHIYDDQYPTGTITDEDAISGKVAYLMNGSTDAGTAWHQRIGIDSHPYPFAISGGSVYGYKTLQCDGTANSVTGYTNTSIKTYQHDGHTVTDGVCSVCGTRFITTAAQLAAFATGVSDGTIEADVTAYIENDLDMNGVSFPGIGNDTYKYHGSLIGNGSKIISNLAIDIDGTDVGLVRVASGGACVKNITTDFTCSFKGQSQVGAIIGTLNGGGDVYVENCGNEAPVEAEQYNVGGLVGAAFSSTIGHFTNCYNVGGVKAGTVANAAGLTFNTDGAVFTNCYSYLNNSECYGLIDNKWFTNTSSFTATNCYGNNSSSNTGITDLSASDMANGTLKSSLGAGYTNMVYGTKAHPGFAAQKYIELREDAVNTLPNENMTSMNVKLYRTLVGDTWNSICLPFDLNADGVISVFGENTKLAEFTGVNGANDDNLHFDLVKSISAKKPYLIYPHDNRDINTPIVLSGITIQVNPETVNYDPFNFIGIYTPTAIDGKYFIASGNTIKKSNGGNLKGFRAYIEDTTHSSSRTLTFDCDDIQVTEISTIANSQKLNANRLIYDLQGRKVMNPTKGMYIVNGKKVVVK